jgi:CheY-like chemotaxis protein
MDGWEFAQRYASLPGEHAPIVAFVAALNAEQECAMLTTASILTKPFDLDDLLKVVRNQLPVAT